MEDRLPELPKGWVRTRIGDVISNVSLTGKKLKQSAYQVIGKYPVIDQGQTFIGGYTDKEEFKISSDTPLIIFGDHTKVFKYIDFQFVAGADGVKVLKPEELYYPKLFYYFAQAVRLPEKGYARHFQWLEKSLIPLPPLPEQHRIVAKIEELFTKLDAGIEALKKIKSQLKRYRQAVLKYAFEGKLTQEWREANKGKIEPASVLLEKTKEERKKETKGKFKELPPLDTSALPELPEGWMWTRIGNLFDITYGLSESLSKTKIDNELDLPVIRIPNITQWGRLDLSELKFFPLEKDKKGNLLVKKGDILFNWRNAPKWIGRSAVFEKEGEFINASFLLKLRPYLEGYSHFISYYLNHLRISGYFLTKVAHAVNQANFNANMTKQVEIIFPPALEQQEIVEAIESRLSMADELEKVAEQSLKQSERLRQSILKQAFEGKLVPQDPTDLPAAELLKQIKKEREAPVCPACSRQATGRSEKCWKKKKNRPVCNRQKRI
jgi:type I restriction enzyme S subunit